MLPDRTVFYDRQDNHVSKPKQDTYLLWCLSWHSDADENPSRLNHNKYGYRSFPQPVCIAAFPALEKHSDGVATQRHSRETLRTRCNELE